MILKEKNKIITKQTATFLLFAAVLILLFFTFSQPSQAAVINVQTSKNTSGLVGYWPFGGRDIAGVTTYDRSGQNSNGTLTNGPTPTTGKIGQSLKFDGSNDYVNLGDVNTLQTTPHTVSVWVKLSTTGISRTIFEDAGDNRVCGTALKIISSDQVELETGDCAGTNHSHRAQGTFTLSANEWYHIVGVFHGWSAKEIYINGTSVATTSSGTAADTIAYGSGQAHIGWWENANVFFNGNIDELRVYNRALPASEIKQLYNSSISVTQKTQEIRLTSGLVGYWAFSGSDIDVSGTTTDRSGQGNHGKLTNNPKVVPGKIGQALEFDGVSSHINAGRASSLRPSLPLSLSVWIKVNSLPSGVRPIISFREGTDHNGYWMELASDGSIELNYGANNSCAAGARRTKTTSANKIKAGQWHHITGVLRGATNMNIYVDGIDVGGTYDGTGGSISYDSTSVLNIGGRSVSCGGGFLNAIIDEVRIYNRGLTTEEVRTLHSQGRSKIQASQQTKQTSNLIGYWSFNGPDIFSTTAYDRSGNNNNGTLNSGPAKVFGRLGQALSFNNSNQSVTAGDIAAVDSATTLSACAWVKHSSITGDDIVVAKTNTTVDGFNLFRDETGSVSGRTDVYTIYIAESSGSENVRIESATNSSPLDTWTHVCFTYKEDTAAGLHLYINGVEDANSPVSTSGIVGIDAGTNSLSIGNVSAINDPFAGSIDEVRLYNSVLEASEVRALYNQGK